MDLSNLSSNLPLVKSLEQVSLVDINKDLTNEFKNTAKAVASLYNSASQPENGDKYLKTEFADAAKAVASLYRTGNSSNVLLMHKGYLDCLDDLLQIITSGEDIENWVLTKRAELTNFYNVNNILGTLSGSSQDKEHDKQARETIIGSDTPGPNTREIHGAGLSKNTTNDKISELKLLASPVDENLARFALPTDHEFSLPEELMTHLMFRPSFPPLSVMPNKKSRRRLDLKSTKMPISLQDASASSDNDSEETNTDMELRKKKKNQMSQDAPKRRKRGSGSDNDGLYP